MSDFYNTEQRPHHTVVSAILIAAVDVPLATTAEVITSDGR